MGPFSTVSFIFAFDRVRSSMQTCTHAHKHACKHGSNPRIPDMRGADKHHCSAPTAVGARPSLENMGTCASLRTEPDPVSASQQRSKLLLLTMRSAGCAPSREAHTRAFPFRSAQISSTPRSGYDMYLEKLLTFSVILIEARMAGGGRVVDVGPAGASTRLDTMHHI